jgi:N-acetyl-anhydromuramoyl-L-alanine amidase
LDVGVMAQCLQVKADGWVHGACHQPSVNFDDRPPGVAIDLLVIHNISLPPGSFGAGNVQRLFANELSGEGHPFFAQLAGIRVSAHFLIERTGALTQFVSCAHRAWHAGASSFAGRSRCNDFSIGIELEGTDFAPFESAQYDTLAVLVPALTLAYPISFARGHAHIAHDRKTDPGPYFDWSRVPSLAALNRP